MEVDMETKNIIKGSYVLHTKIFDLLQITSHTKKVSLWNKYQILLYETSDFNSKPMYFEPVFKVINVVFNDNYLACLDYANNIHIMSLKDKKKCNKYIIPNKPVVKNIIYLDKIESNEIITLQNNVENYIVYLHDLNKFQNIVSKYILQDLENITESKNIILKSHTISSFNIECLDMIFKITENKIFNGILVIIILDYRTVYGFILDKGKRRDNGCMKKLYYSSIDVCDVNIIELEYNLSILISLKSGTVIKLSFGTDLIPQVIHLNSLIRKLITKKDKLIYTDGISMWKTEKSFTKDITFQELFVKYVRDFDIINDLVICVTFSNIIYVFSLDDKIDIIDENEYQPVNSVEQSIELLLKEIKMNDELVKTIEIERNYTIAISLANRQDLINELIQHSVTVFDSYEEVLIEISNFNLTDELHEYFNSNSTLFFITLIFKTEYNKDLKNVYLSLTDLLKLHITIRNKSNIIKTIGITIKDLDQCNYLVPIKCCGAIEFNVNLKLICPIGYLYDNEPNWVILFNKNVKLTSESFIKTTKSDEIVKITQLREPRDDFSALILKTASNYNGMLNFQNETLKQNEVTYYVKLPKDYEVILSNKSTYVNINNNKAEFLLKKLSAKEFLKRNHIVQINIHEYKIKLEIIMENMDAMLKLTGENAFAVFLLRNYFHKIICKNNKQIIAQAEYTNIENLRRKLVKSLCSRKGNADDVMQIANEFNKNVIGDLI